MTQTGANSRSLVGTSSIRTVGLCGLGQMGTGIAVCFRRAGYRVLAWDANALARESFGERAGTLDAWLDENVSAQPGNGGVFEVPRDLEQLDEEADLFMDCTTEDLELKIHLFAALNRIRERSAVVLTTTSGLSITRMSAASGLGARLAGAHFWNPPHLIPLVEVIRGEHTDERVMECASRVIESLGKIPVRVEKDVPGFIGNRLLHAMWREAIEMVDRGIATPADIDRVARLTFGLRLPVMGPLENMDLVGLELVRQIHEYLLADLSDARKPQEGVRRRLEQGRRGLEQGHGFYSWKGEEGPRLVRRRDEQILRQLRYLREIDAL